MRALRQLILLGGMLCLDVLAQKPPVRLLSIGNSQYQKLGHVPSAEADVSTVVKAFQEVARPLKESALNLTTPSLRDLLEKKFIPSVQAGEVVILHFSGRAVQIEGDNYLLGTDFDPSSEALIQDAGILVSRIQRLLSRQKPGLLILLLDASYDDPQLARLPGYTPGLGDSRDVDQAIIVHSAAKDQTAPPPGNGASPLAAVLAELVRKPGLTMAELAAEIRQGVSNRTAGALKPNVRLTYAGDFRFVDPPPVEAPKPEVRTEVRVVREGGPERKQHRDDREFYILVPAGTFQMGCVPGSDCESHEQPRHEVRITKPFWLGENEVQVASYQRFVKLTGRKMPRAPLGVDWKNESLPMVMVSWDDAQQYCSWVGGRLPTEAEWEYAARGGIADQIYPMKDFSQARDAANYKGTSGNDTYDWIATVRKFDKNPWGLFDMSGNVWEWVQDWYAEDFYARSPADDPSGPSSGKDHVIRGGSFDSDPRKHLRLSYRDKSGSGLNKIGFRCALPESSSTRAKLQ